MFAHANERIAALSDINSQRVIPFALYLVMARKTRIIKRIEAGISSAITVPEVK